MTLFSAAEIAEDRALAESRMLSRVTIRRRKTKPDGSPDWTTDSDGYEHPAWLDVATDVPFRLHSQRGAATYRTVTIGGLEVSVATRPGSVPVGTPLLDADLLLVTSGEASGRVLHVVESTPGDQASALRVPLVEIAPPEEW